MIIIRIKRIKKTTNLKKKKKKKKKKISIVYDKRRVDFRLINIYIIRCK